ncbi:MAG: PEP-CTERM sorting domain-containing protein, partial [Cupriavidus sp.]
AYTGVTTLTSGTLEVTSLANGGTSTTAAAVVALGSSQLQLASVSGLTVGQTITASGIAAGTTITAIDTGTNTITLSTATIGAIASGATTITGTANSLGLATSAASNLILGAGSTFKYTGSGSSTDRLFKLSGGNSAVFTLDASGTGALAFTNTAAIEHANNNVSRTVTLTGTNTDSNTIASVITNSGTGLTGVNKTGAGKWVLSGANTFSGTTTVNAGTLIVGNSVSSAYNSAITVNAGTLGGLGNSSKNVTVGNGLDGNDAFISPGDGGIGTFATTGSMSLLADAVFRFELRGNGTPAADVLQASSVAINSSALFSFTLLGDMSGLVVGQTFTIINNAGVSDISGGFSNLTAGGIYNAGSGLTFSVSGGAGSYGNDLVLTVATVPEPGTVTLMTLAGLSVVLLRRRKNSAA